MRDEAHLTHSSRDSLLCAEAVSLLVSPSRPVYTVSSTLLHVLTLRSSVRVFLPYMASCKDIYTARSTGGQTTYHCNNKQACLLSVMKTVGSSKLRIPLC